MKVVFRKLLQIMDDNGLPATLSSPSAIYSPETLLPGVNASSPSVKKRLKQANSTAAPFDSSVALTFLVLIAALFVMAFFSVYLRRFNREGGAASSRARRYQSHRSSARSHNPAKGLGPSAVPSLPLVPYGGNAKHPIEHCAICLTEFEEGETVKKIPHCRHVFHPACIDTWLSSHVTCPLCRSAQLSDSDEENGLRVVRITANHGMNGSERRSTVNNIDTWTAVGAVGVRRTGSCSNLDNNNNNNNRMALQRTASF